MAARKKTAAKKPVARKAKKTSFRTYSLQAAAEVADLEHGITLISATLKEDNTVEARQQLELLLEKLQDRRNTVLKELQDKTVEAGLAGVENFVAIVQSLYPLPEADLPEEEPEEELSADEGHQNGTHETSSFPQA